MAVPPMPAGSSSSPDPVSSFDVLPYPHRAFAQTHPDVLATVATVFGMTPPAVETGRGVGMGGGRGGEPSPIVPERSRAPGRGIDPSGWGGATRGAGVPVLRAADIQLR